MLAREVSNFYKMHVFIPIHKLLKYIKFNEHFGVVFKTLNIPRLGYSISILFHLYSVILYCKDNCSVIKYVFYGNLFVSSLYFMRVDIVIIRNIVSEVLL